GRTHQCGHSRDTPHHHASTAHHHASTGSLRSARLIVRRPPHRRLVARRPTATVDRAPGHHCYLAAAAAGEHDRQDAGGEIADLPHIARAAQVAASASGTVH